MRRRFREEHFVPLPRLLGGELLAGALARLARAAYAPCDVTAERYIDCLKLVDKTIDVGLSFLFNDPALFAAVRAVAGCGPIKGFMGRVIRHDPGKGHYLDWHSDHRAGGPDRLAALRVNLSPRPFRGGHLVFRDARGRSLGGGYRSGVPGDAVLFRAGKDSWHRNTDVLGATPKISLSGWFYAVARGGGSIRMPGRSIYSSRNLELAAPRR